MLTQTQWQLVAVLQWMASFVLLGFGCLFGFVYCFLFSQSIIVRTLLLLYVIWYVFDRDAPERGGHRSEWVRSWRVWRLFRDYFPVRLVRTAALEKHRNYLFVVHPHGILCFGAWCNFGTNANNFYDLFPGLTPYLLVLKGHFDFPFYRDYVMKSGMVAVTKSSLEYLSKQKGVAAVLLPGGAAEALDSRPEEVVLRLRDKKGFVKTALRLGYDLVPVLSFGENEVLLQAANPEGSLLRRIQMSLMKICGFSMPVMQFVIPQQRQINTVVGSAVCLPSDVTQPTSDDVDRYHQKYMNALERLFNEHKTKYGYPETYRLKFI